VVGWRGGADDTVERWVGRGWGIAFWEIGAYKVCGVPRTKLELGEARQGLVSREGTSRVGGELPSFVVWFDGS
jgi:hypothetical protein